jgi:hypothetical protein
MGRNKEDKSVIQQALQLAKSEGWKDDKGLLSCIETAQKDGNMEELKDFLAHPKMTKITLFLNLTIK